VNRAAHNSIFPFPPNSSSCIRFQVTLLFPFRLARPLLGHTVKDPSFEGTKKPTE